MDYKSKYLKYKAKYFKKLSELTDNELYGVQQGGGEYSDNEAINNLKNLFKGQIGGFDLSDDEITSMSEAEWFSNMSGGFVDDIGDEEDNDLDTSEDIDFMEGGAESTETILGRLRNFFLTK